MNRKITALFLLGALTCAATEFRVKPGDGSFERAAQSWKKGDTILLAPGTYYSRFEANDAKQPPCGLTIKAEIPGTAHFRGDRPAPVFKPHAKGIWKAHWDKIPETVLEHDTLTHYKYMATPSSLQQESGSWSYDAKTKTLFIRTTDSGDPARHALSIGVTPWPCINFYCNPSKSSVQDVLLDGFVTTGYYSRLCFPDQRIRSSQKKVAWGVVINHPTHNVKVTNVTAVLNAYGIGFCGGAKNSAIENCRAFGNRNVYNYSGGGIGIFNGADNCILRGNLGADQSHDVWLYSGPIKPTTIFENNKGYGAHRVKASKQKGFVVHNCVAGNGISHVAEQYFMSNCVAFGHNELAEILSKNNLLLRYENGLKPDAIFADPVNFDCRVQDGVPESIVKRAPTFSNEKIFYWSRKGNDSANGRSVKNAFASFGRVLQELVIHGTEVYLVSSLRGDLKLKGLKDIAIRGRGAFPIPIRGKIILEDCSNVKLERLAPSEFIIRGSSNIQINQSAGKISADKVDGFRITHNYIPTFTLNGAKNCFITANVFEKVRVKDMSGWSDYNAYADKVPAEEKNSFTAKAQLGKNFTFKNAWAFDGRAIDSMPVGPFRRQLRNVQLELGKPEVQLLAPDTAVVKLTANIPFNGSILWGDPSVEGVHEIKLFNLLNTQAAVLSGLTPGKKYFYQLKIKAEIPQCFSNAELIRRKASKNNLSEKIEFTTPDKYFLPQNYFVAKDGNDANSGSKDKPFGTIGHAVTKLRPGDTLTIRGGTYEENFPVQVSGTKERPIVIQGMRGERVILCAGFGSPLTGGITVMNQNYIHFKDFVIHGDSTPGGFAEYAFRTINCKGLLFKRLLVSGSHHKINAINCEDIFVEDCGFIGGHEGVYFTDCKNQVFSHCTFAMCGLMQIMLRNTTRGKATIENCIFLNTVNQKGRTPVIYITDITTLTEGNNCYYNRMPFDQKPLLGWDYVGKKMAEQNAKQGARVFPYCGRSQKPYPEYQKLMNRYNTGSFAANPGIKVYPKYGLTYTSFADWEKNWVERGKTDRSGEGRWLKTNPELQRDLKYFLPTNPEVIKRGCGPRLK